MRHEDGESTSTPVYLEWIDAVYSHLLDMGIAECNAEDWRLDWIETVGNLWTSTPVV